jgi:hypothetical protein
MEFPCAIIQPHTDKRYRLDTVIVVRTSKRLQDAFGELDRMAAKLHGLGLAGDSIEMLAVDRDRHPVQRGIESYVASGDREAPVESEVVVSLPDRRPSAAAIPRAIEVPFRERGGAPGRRRAYTIYAVAC